MKTTYILLLCILGAALFSTAVCHSSTGPDDCCFEFYQGRIRKDLIKSYYMTDSRCTRAAAILVTGKKGYKICVDPSLSWVKGIIRSLDEKSF